MAERKPGPVKPPVIDLAARPVAAGESVPPETAAPTKPEAAAPTRPEPTRPEPTRPEPAAPEPARPAGGRRSEAPARRANPLLPAVAAALLGAAIAVAVGYGLAYEGWWPNGALSLEGRLAGLEQRLGESEKAGAGAAAAAAGATEGLATLRADLTARLDAATATLESLKASLATRAATPPPPAVDLGPLEAQVKTLSGRLDAVAAGASSADAGALAANLATVQQNLAGLTEEVAVLQRRAAAGEAALDKLAKELDGARTAIAEAAAAPSARSIASAMQLPLLISALEADFAAGRPYAADLGALTAAVPETHVPDAVGAAAATGLPSPGQLVAGFEAAMPDMIAARPAAAEAGWQEQAADWLRGLLALRPTGEQPGDAPEAVLSRLEAAVRRHDFAGAAALLGQLPPPMQRAAGEAGRQLAVVAAAQQFVAGLRQTALAPARGTAQ